MALFFALSLAIEMGGLHQPPGEKCTIIGISNIIEALPVI